MLVLQDIIATAPGAVSRLLIILNDGVGGFSLSSRPAIGEVEDARPIVVAGGTSRVCVGGNKAVGCFNIAIDGTLTLINVVSTEVTPPSRSESIIVDASGAWLLLPIVTQNSIQAYRIDPASGELSLSSQASVGGTPRGVVFTPDNQHLVTPEALDLLDKLLRYDHQVPHSPVILHKFRTSLLCGRV